MSDTEAVIMDANIITPEEIFTKDIQKPKKPKTEAQLKALEKGRLKRAENVKRRKELRELKKIHDKQEKLKQKERELKELEEFEKVHATIDSEEDCDPDVFHDEEPKPKPKSKTKPKRRPKKTKRRTKRPKYTSSDSESSSSEELSDCDSAVFHDEEQFTHRIQKQPKPTRQKSVSLRSEERYVPPSMNDFYQFR